ncbi:Fic family protein [Streptomyces sp. NPDC013489]|uniref:Fic family protein n=1 Tax=Streptomyces sp. NPDC013489 TaxID=3155606 RepID=UPI0033CA6564
MGEVDDIFAGTPYLISEDEAATTRFRIVEEKATRSREKSIAVQERIAIEGQEMFEPYVRAIRTRLVAESNRIEGYDWTYRQVNEVALTYRELLQAPVGSLMQAVRQDPRVYEALGLYKAHEIADEWARGSVRPREYEMRSLHELIASGEAYAGRYKEVENEIGGTRHRTSAPWEVPIHMRELSDWWQQCDVNPALEATVVHAWLTHIHPFEDGNGRMARLLANMSLARNGFPPLLVRSSVDRGQYYDALARSDDGDMLPLYDLFVQVLNRTVRLMSRPDYVREIVKDRLLSTVRDRFDLWKILPDQFFIALSEAFKARGWSVLLQGNPDLSSYALLEDLDLEGNSWFGKVLDGDRVPQWLLWYGFKSEVLRDLDGSVKRYPSIFVSVRDENPEAIHPYRPLRFDEGPVEEIVLRPMEPKTVLLRRGYDIEEKSILDAAKILAGELAS